MQSSQLGSHRAFRSRAAVPVVLALVMFAGLIFGYLLPQQERLIVEHKKEMLRELTASAVSVLSEFEREIRSGALSSIDGQRIAVQRLRDMRYGREGKDYFWITDQQPRMVMHPYRPDLEGKDMGNYRDPDGKALFVEARAQVLAQGEGFIEYRWQWKDDAGRVVPKLSYVRGFPAWGYIVGTGVYLDDVHQQMRGLRARLLSATLAILAIVVLLMLYGMKQALSADAQARRAFLALRDSEQKYRLLSEAVSEGSLLAADGQVLHPNRALLEMFSCDVEALVGKSVDSLFVDADVVQTICCTMPQLETGTVWQKETQIRTPSGTFMVTEITACTVELLGRRAVSVVLKDVSAGKRLAGELARSRERAKWLAGRLGLGLFRAQARGNWPLLEVDGALECMMGKKSRHDLVGKSLLDFAIDPAQVDQLRDELAVESALHSRAIQVRDLEGRIRTWSISAVIADTGDNSTPAIDGLVEDITLRKEAELRRGSPHNPELADLLASARPIGAIGRAAPTCDMHESIANLAATMNHHDADVCLIVASDGSALGIATWKAIAVALSPGGPGPDAPCNRAMAAPLPLLPPATPLFAAMHFVQAERLTHFGVRGTSGAIDSVANIQDLLHRGGHTLLSVLHAMTEADTEEALLQAHARVPELARVLLESSASPAPASRTLTAIADTFTKRATELAMTRLGPPPLEFTFLALGSEGRGEQTLVTDQDNAILWADPIGPLRESAEHYFLLLGEAINATLHRAGYAYCEGKVMAGYPDWNMSLSHWREKVSRWIRAADPTSLLAINIFFDFRPVCGAVALAAALREHIAAQLLDNHAFFHNFAANILEYRPPLGFFGKIRTDTEEGHAASFNIKSAIVPLVGFARLYALRHGVSASGTLERLDQLKELGLLTPMGHTELTDAFNCLMGLRLRHQAAQRAIGQAPDNLISPKTIGRFELARLREALGQIQIVQERVKLEWLRKE